MKQVFPLTIQSGMSQSGSYVLMLGERESGLQIPIFIGAYEAQGILLAKETVQTRRPMTHELMVHVMQDYGLSLKEVSIDRVMEGIFRRSTGRVCHTSFPDSKAHFSGKVSF